MTDTTRDELMAMSDVELEARMQNLDAIWKRLDRKSDPRGTYTEQQGHIEKEKSLIAQILDSRRQA